MISQMHYCYGYCIAKRVAKSSACYYDREEGQGKGCEFVDNACGFSNLGRK